MQFSSKLKELRTNAGLTQEEVAKRLYVLFQSGNAGFSRRTSSFYRA